ncbi:TetR family transcriptional regulator [Actinacidiphila sp. bgisy144]|uniref:TetR/AcrR family transcriptional regulator n=1 Tax=unclassified Actinacidiphila TaxID=2995708 RepID=UPI003EB6D970
MAWDTERTKRLLLEAAVVEFAERGLEGASMAAIAERAGINKERLYRYFGDKDSLFDTVLAGEMNRLADAVDWPGGQEFQHIGAYAGRLFDYHTEHPHLVRLLLQEGFTGRAGDAAVRGAKYRAKVEVIEAAQREGHISDDIPADHLLFMLIGLAAWWSSVPQLATFLSGRPAQSEDEISRRRSSVVLAAERLALRHGR